MIEFQSPDDAIPEADDAVWQDPHQGAIASVATGSLPAPDHSTVSEGSGNRRRFVRLALVVLPIVCFLAWSPISESLRERRILYLQKWSKSHQALEEWEQLEDVSLEWLKTVPASVDATLKLALAQEKQGYIEEAVATLATVPDSDDRVLDALAIRIDMLLSKLNRPSEAEADCFRLIRINPQAGRGYQRLIYYYAMTLQRAKLSNLIDDAIQAGCEPPEAYTYRLLLTSLSFSDGEQTCARWLTGEPENVAVLVAHAWYKALGSSSAVFSESNSDLENKVSTKAMSELLETYSGNLEVLAFHIERALQAGDWSSAADLLGLAQQDAENDSRFWRYKAVLLESQKQYQGAITSAQKAIELNAIDWRGHHRLATLLRLTGEAEKAGRQSEIALTGKELERELLQLPSARAWSPGLPERVLKYLALCGDASLRKSLLFRCD